MVRKKVFFLTVVRLAKQIKQNDSGGVAQGTLSRFVRLSHGGGKPFKHNIHVGLKDSTLKGNTIGTWCSLNSIHVHNGNLKILYCYHQAFG